MDKHIDKAGPSSPKKREDSPTDFAAGKTYEGVVDGTKKKVKFNESPEEGHPISKYRDHKDVEIVAERSKIDVLHSYQEDFKSTHEDIKKLYNKLENLIGKNRIEGEITFTMEDCDNILKDCEKICNEYRTRSSTEKTIEELSKHIDKLANMFIALNEVEVNLTPYSDDDSPASP